MRQMTIRVLVADDDATVRLSLRRTFAGQQDIDLVGEAADGEEALALAQRVEADVIVMDEHMPKLSGLEAIKRMRSLGIDTPVLILSADARVAPKARRIKRVRFLLKGDAGVRDTVEAIRAISQAS